LSHAAGVPREYWKRFCEDEKVQKKNWLAVDAVVRELFSCPNSVLSGKNTGNLRVWSKPYGSNSKTESALSKRIGVSGTIGTANDQGRNRESEFPDTDVVVKCLWLLAGVIQKLVFRQASAHSVEEKRNLPPISCPSTADFEKWLPGLDSN
jgi:hypothetical protein